MCQDMLVIRHLGIARKVVDINNNILAIVIIMTTSTSSFPYDVEVEETKPQFGPQGHGHLLHQLTRRHLGIMLVHRRIGYPREGKQTILRRRNCIWS
ncbi:hypothetical protein TorRG33x02_317440 [Trema orientale]|uniref:Uncharacterized protein n=1 Tax=Trema orientale TaxID=63057 RepID=A0A2P5BL47_TREOI|nr:hypothetical protein TorRG33x02_317440 [Trema orientale]